MSHDDQPLSRDGLLREAHRAAMDAGFDDPVWGTAVILATALAGIAEQMPNFRRVANGRDWTDDR
jgi:hypothetical protein